MKLFNDKTLPVIYFIAFIASIIAFFAVRKWIWIPLAVVWLLLGIVQLMSNRNNNNLRK